MVSHKSALNLMRLNVERESIKCTIQTGISTGNKVCLSRWQSKLKLFMMLPMHLEYRNIYSSIHYLLVGNGNLFSQMLNDSDHFVATDGW